MGSSPTRRWSEGRSVGGIGSRALCGVSAPDRIETGGSVECEVNRRNAVIGHRRDNNGEWSKSVRNKIAWPMVVVPHEAPKWLASRKVGSVEGLETTPADI